MDPYIVTGLLAETTILWEPTLEAEALAAKKLALKVWKDKDWRMVQANKPARGKFDCCPSVCMVWFCSAPFCTNLQFLDPLWFVGYSDVFAWTPSLNLICAWLHFGLNDGQWNALGQPGSSVVRQSVLTCQVLFCSRLNCTHFVYYLPCMSFTHFGLVWKVVD